MKAYLDWMRGAALPTWATLGFDAERGRFRERLDMAGRPIDVPHRAMVQARQIYVYAHAALNGWYPEGGALAERAMAGVMRHYLRDSGGKASFAFSIAADGTVASDARDSYTHAFMLFATAWLYRLTGDTTLLDLADRITAFIEAELFDPEHGGVYDTLPLTTEDKRQNPLMHLLEAYLAVERAAPGRGYAERARALVALFRTRLFEPAHGVLLEYFARDWSPLADAKRATLWEPGHHFEWVWLLDEYRQLVGEDVSDLSGRLFATAVAQGFAADGLIVDEVHAGGAVAKASHRVWPHTEAIKAAVARFHGGAAAAPQLAEAMGAALLGTFLSTELPGGWIDHVTAEGAPLVDYMPASSLYHLFFAAAEAARLPAAA